jgi:protein-S-isoprenylcysteine O-methyltransferase Ste14
MTLAVDHRPRDVSRAVAGRFVRALGLGYGVMVYAVFLASLLYATGFVSGFVVPRGIDTGTIWPAAVALCIDLQLLGLFAIQHSGMARRGFRRILTGHVSPVVESSTYILCCSLTLILLLAAWQPLPSLLWQAGDPQLVAAIRALAALGWLIALYSIFVISHSELFGVRQVVLNFAGRTESAVPFRTPGPYRFVRHPVYLGLMIAFWAAPTMTAGHFLFASVTTACMGVSIWLEERGAMAFFGDRYREYREQVSMLLPGQL